VRFRPIAGNSRRAAALVRRLRSFFAPTGRYLFDPASRGVFFALRSLVG
jgi:hypothetical protein